LVWWHTPNGGKRRAAEAAILKGFGTRAGVADLIFVHRGRPFALELKTDDGRPTVAQMAFVSDFNAAGGSAVIVNGLDHALRTLETWGLLRGTTQWAQPAPLGGDKAPPATQGAA
jgi:hypothetical protein